MTEKKAPSKPYTVITSSDIQTAKFQEYLSMNWRNDTNMNPRITRHLKSTSEGTFSFIEIGEIGTDGAEAAVGVTTAENPEKVPLDWSNNQRTAKFSLYRLIAKHPALRVARGYLRKIPVALRTESGVSFLALNLKASTVEPAPKREKKVAATEEGQSK